MTLMRLYGNLAPGCESYMLAAHSELPNSIPRNVPKPLKKLGPPDRTVVQSHSETIYPRPISSLVTLALTPSRVVVGLRAAVELSSTSYLDVGAVGHNLLRGGNSASGMSSLRSTSGGMNSEAGSGGSGDDGNGNDVGTCGGKCSNDGRGGSSG
ncbi:hypothetical protein Tco_0666339 [Tanacetum coccineum]